jgi:hypothetical protein
MAKGVITVQLRAHEVIADLTVSFLEFAETRY